MHFLVVGDSGMGKSATIRLLLPQFADRGEVIIVCGPATEYLPQF
jgi:type IV secretory pathway VirB4 component